MEINDLLKVEAKSTATMQGAYKTIILQAVRKHGLDKPAIMAEIRPKLAKLAKINVRTFLQMGVNWLK